MAFEAANSRGGSRGGGRGRGFGRGDLRGGGRGGSRGFRGGDRGGRGGFRGGDRGGSMRGAFRGGNRDFNGGSRGRNPNEEGGPPVCHEIAHALQLRISYKADVPTEDDILQQFPGLHSRFQKSTENKDYFLLFKDIESLENAKAKLEKDDAIKTVDFMGLKSARNEPLSIENRQIFLQFTSEQDEDAVKKLDSKILSVEFLKDKSNCLAEFATAEEANGYLKKLAGVKDRGDLKFGRESTAMKVNNLAKASIQPNHIVVRDIPKKATLKDLAPLYPDANSVVFYNATFPSSDYCHASYRFENLDRVESILSETKNPKILGKKVYVFPAYSCLLADMPKLGEAWTGDKNVAAKSDDAALVKDSKQSPNKKMKLEDDDMNGDEEDEEDDDDEEESDEEEQNGKADNEANMESAADQEDESEDDEEEEGEEEEESDE